MSTSVLQSFGPGLWLADGPAVTAIAGFRYPTRMAVAALPQGVALWSPIPPTDELRAAIAALGPVRALIAPNSLHDMFVADWARACPEAELHAAPGLAAKRPDLAVAAELGDIPPPAWAGTLDQVLVGGNRITTETVFFHRPSRTVLFCDLIQQFPRGWHRGWRGLVARLDLMVEPEPAVPRKFRAAFTDRAVARAAVERIVAWPADRVVMAHGAPVERDGQAFLGRAFRWLRT